ncbi:hypothetical protein PFISCL1PPCAC_27681, partial [Pristionchus fissidentatus]
LLLVGIGLTSSCSFSDHRENHALHQFRSKLVKRMEMTEEQIKGVNQSAVAEARSLLPMLEHHRNHEEIETIFLMENKYTNIAPPDHLFAIPSSLSGRRIQSAYI